MSLSAIRAIRHLARTCTGWPGRTFGVVRSSRYWTLSEAKSSMTSCVMRVRMAWSVVT